MCPRLLDLFCAAGGASVGYHRAGFEVVGVDIEPQPNYPFEFHRRDAMTLLAEMAYERTTKGFDAIHASTPCPRYSSITPHDRRDDHPDLYEDARTLLRRIGLPWVIENVIGAPYESGVVLCGSMFGMRVRRHRNFESSHLLYAPGPCRHREQGEVLGVYGNGGGGKSTRPSGGGGTKAHRHQFAELMGMPWATPKEIVLAVPPAYTEWIGSQLLAHVGATP